MKKNMRKVGSLTLAASIALSSAIPALAKDFDVLYRENAKKYTDSMSIGTEPSLSIPIGKSPKDYMYEYDGKYFDLDTIAEAYDEANGDTDRYLEILKSKDYIGLVDGEEEDLKVESISAINNTSVVVEFKDRIEGKVDAKDFSFDGGLEVHAADKLSGDKRVRLVTSKQTEGKVYKLSINGKDTGKTVTGVSEEYQNKFEIKSVEARTNTSVVVRLTDAPLTKLSPKSFDINGLEILKVNTTDNMVTLTTSPQESKEYKVIALEGKGEGTFTGKAAVKADQAIEKVELANYREVKVDFTEPMTWASASNPANYYIGMTKLEEDLDLQKASLEEISGTEKNWTIVPAHLEEVYEDEVDENGNLIEKENAKVTSVIIRSDKDLMVNGSENTGDALNNTNAFEAEKALFKINEAATIEFRHLVRGYINSEAYEFIARDTKAPEVVGVEDIVEGDDKLEIVFSEPILQEKSVEDDAASGREFNIKLNSKTIQATRGTDTVDSYRTFTISGDAVKSLKPGKHKITVAGARDLSGKLQEPNYKEIEFEVKKKATKPEVGEVKPIYEEMYQVADNVLAIKFKEGTLKDVAALAGSKIKLEKAKLNDEDEWEDVEFKIEGDNFKVADNTLYVKLNGLKDEGDIYTDNLKGDESFEKEFYNGQMEVARRVTLSLQGKEDATDYKKQITFTKDNKAPVIVRGEEFNIDHNLYVVFKDQPFVAPNGSIALGDKGTITITKTDKNNVTKAATITLGEDENTPNAAEVVAVEDGEELKEGQGINNAVKIDLKKLDDKDMLPKDGDVYEIKFAKGTVTDAEEGFFSEDDNKQFANLLGVNEIPETKVSLTASIKEDKPEIDDARVPQTSPALITSNSDNVKSDAGTDYEPDEDEEETSSNASKVDPTVKDKFEDVKGILPVKEAGQNQILVVFDGQVLAETAKDLSNYRIDGERLPSNAKIRFYEENLKGITADDDDGKAIAAIDHTAEDLKTAYVVIELPKGSTKVSADYKLEIEGITNVDGKKMLPVETKVNLIDDTPAALEEVVLRGTDEVHLVFDDIIDIADENDILDNITVTIEGHTTTIKKVERAEDDDHRLIVRIDHKVPSIEGKTVTVKIAKDRHNQVHIIDNSILENQVQPVTMEGPWQAK